MTLKVVVVITKSTLADYTKQKNKYTETYTPIGCVGVYAILFKRCK